MKAKSMTLWCRTHTIKHASRKSPRSKKWTQSQVQGHIRRALNLQRMFVLVLILLVVVKDFFPTWGGTGSYCVAPGARARAPQRKTPVIELMGAP